MDNKQAASKVFKTIKDTLTSYKKADKNNQHKRAFSVDVSWNDKTITGWDEKTKQYKNLGTTYEIFVDGVPVVTGIKDYRNMSYIFEDVCDMLDAQRKVKGWGTIVYQTEKFRPVSMSLYANPVTVITKVSVPSAPCKEYNALEKYLNKYGQKKTDGYWGTLTSLNLTPFQLYYVRSGGKRGRLWGEEGERRYLANRPQTCTEILTALRKHRTSKDTMICRFGREEYIDPIDKRYSEYHETECDGEIREYLHIEIHTDKGKVKFETDIY
jgi:hypothetical protein